VACHFVSNLSVRYPRKLLVLIVVFVSVLSGCHRTLPPIEGSSSTTEVVGGNRHYTIVRAGADESYENLARQFAGDRIDSWTISEANGNGAIDSGSFVVIPRSHENPVGVYKEGHQVVPVLSYHRIDTKRSRMSVTPTKFEKHLAYLSRKGFHAASLDDLESFLKGKKQLPLRSVVITIDDGYASTYKNAFPVLKKYNFMATIFIYTD